MTKRIILFIFFCLIGISLLAGYILYDNSRIVVREQTVEIDQLDPAFDGFTILQLSDLHSARFGKNQERLIKLVNSLPYDMIAVTGDMVDRAAQNPLPFLELLDGLSNKQMIFYVDGNVDPPVLERRSGAPTNYGRLLQENGCMLLDKPTMILRSGAHIWVSDGTFKVAETEKWINDIKWKLKTETNPKKIEILKRDLHHQTELKTILTGISGDEVLIGLSHYPLTPYNLDNPLPQDIPVYDLLLAGHYHGGQIRIPFIGAIYIPDPSPDHFFPPEELVSGFYKGKQTSQYISRGLGYSSYNPFLNFRLFNPPEITLISLKKNKH